MTKNIILIFSDGASRGNPGRGGFGSIVVHGKKDDFSDNSETANFKALHLKELGGRDDLTTNNKMELSAVISALEYSDKNSTSAEFNIYTDSKYVITGAKAWIFGWKRNGWKTMSGGMVKNQDLWESLSDLISGKKINWVLLPGHAGVAGNERCDQIATEFADDINNKNTDEDSLFDGKLSDYEHKDILDIYYNPLLIQVAKDDKKASGSKKTGSSAKAYSYVSKVDGKINIDQNWTDCEKKVKGKRGALYKKSTSLSDQEKIIKDFNSR